MKFISPFLLCVSALCIANAAGSYSLGEFLPAIASSQIHGMHKRNAELNQLKECQAIISDEQCNNGLIQESANVLLQCNQRQSADIVVGRCRRNSNGDYCNLASAYILDVNSAAAECLPSGETCTTRCRNLLMLLRNDLGCCLNLEFNSTLSPLYSPAVFTSALWSSCSVEPVTEECTPSTAQITLTQIDSSCTGSNLFRRASSLICTRRYLQPILDRLTEGCEPYRQAALEQCAIDELKQPCYVKASALSLQFQSAITGCGNTDTSVCDAQCTERLETFAREGGCCINNFFNGSLAGITTIRYNWFSSQYWFQCGLDSPGFCETRLTDEPLFTNGGVILKAPVFFIISTTVMMWYSA